MTALVHVSLDDKYALDSGRVFLTGTQALVRLLMMQRQRDALAGLNTAGFVSGYRGSPLGGFDQALWKARDHLKTHHIHFQPGINEDLGATAVWGSQQVNLFRGATRDGVFGLWYGKGPGVDRTGDVFKHANAAGTSRFGGVLAVAGDDHACKSSTLPHQSEYAFMDAQMPVLNPAGVQEILDLGIFGWELSRYSGLWIGFKTIAETVDSSASVHVDPQRVRIVLPEDFELPPDGLHIRWPDKPLEQELRLQKYKLYAALAFARANKLNHIVVDSPQPRLGIVTTGKSYLDVMQALDDLHIDANEAARIGLRVYKVGMSWPLEREGVRHFAEGLEEILVVEEKRAVIENQLKEQLYNWREDVRPRVIGKFDEQREWILPSTGELTPARIARVIAARIRRFYQSEHMEKRLAFLDAKERALSQPREVIERVPHFCSGCPHNTSTRVPEGSRAMAGIGCHYMVTWMDRNTETFTQMGGEGVPWIGQAPFTETQHVFANLGDGTYFHSGLLAIRAALASGVNITYKLLYNDAVAMTGGQPVEGQLSVPQISHQLYGEGVRRLAVVSDEPQKYKGHEHQFAKGVSFHHRDELDTVQKALREVKGTSVIIYDQVCATEKRRRRKRGKMVDPKVRPFINTSVCEGCGDCSVQSNCLSIIPVETPLGRKRAIDQSSCNKDFSCIKGFCPSFVTVEGGDLKRSSGIDASAIPTLPTPAQPALDAPYDLVITGVGGTGVVTVGALLGMASHLESKGVSVLDMTGLAQKYGAVVSHVRIAREPEAIHAVRITAGNARVLLGCDLVVAASFDALAKLDAEHSYAVVNTHASMPAGFTRNPDMKFPGQAMLETVRDATGKHTYGFDATELATRLLGDAIYSNPMVLGFAWQKGLIPLSDEALLEAMRLNGVAVAANQQAFQWGRYAAEDLDAVLRHAALAAEEPKPETLQERIERRAAFLVGYQDQALADRYRQRVEATAKAAKPLGPAGERLVDAVAQAYFKLLSYKDEYEVARLFTDGSFQRQVEGQFQGDYRLKFHLAPPLISRIDPNSGRPKKRTFGPWILPVMRVLARMKRWRGTALDVFGYTAERRMERGLIADYEARLDEILRELNGHNVDTAAEWAALPLAMRGFGPVKDANVKAAKARETELLALFRNPPRPAQAA